MHIPRVGLLRGVSEAGAALLLIPWLLAATPAQADPSTQVRLVSSHLAPYAIEGGEQAGFMVDLVRAIETRLGTERPVRFLPWPRSLRLAKNEANYLILPLTRTPEREPHYRWLLKVAPIEMAFITADREPLSLAEARLLNKISVQQDTPFEHFLQRQGFTNLVRLPDPGPLHLRMLSAGRTQAWFTAKDLAAYTSADTGQDGAVVLGETVYLSDVYIATSLEFPEAVAAAYLRAYQELVEDGSLEAIMGRYQRNH